MVISDNFGFGRGGRHMVDVVTGKYLFIVSCRSLLIGIVGLGLFLLIN